MIAMLLLPARAHAVLDVNDRGPTLSAGGFAMRVTNAGILGNAFFDVGLSSDPSFEFPPHSGQELLNYAALWVGARVPLGETRVSGGPLLEWRPTLDPNDRVRVARHGEPGTRRMVDDDGDGRVDEEILNGRDDDGDHEIDEDLGFSSQEMLAADYVDDRPEAVDYVYEGGETHRPLGLSVHQEVYGWSAPGYSGIAGLQFHITNYGSETLKDVYVGLFADLDSRRRSDRSGFLNDQVTRMTFSRSIPEGTAVITGAAVTVGFSCIARLQQTLPVVEDGARDTKLPMITVVPLDHTTDPLAYITPVASYARAPGGVRLPGGLGVSPGEETVRTAVFSRIRPPGQGGVPNSDSQRYAALSGELSGTREDLEDDFIVLVSCGPFPSLLPGQSLDFAAALVAASSAESLAAAVSNALFVHRGTTANLIPDVLSQPDPTQWYEGRTGLNGHEACIEAPSRVTFDWDPHCPGKFLVGGDDTNVPRDLPEAYRPGQCIWTDADCSACTGFNGRETILRWRDPGAVPPPPSLKVTPLDRVTRIEWDNQPEILIGAGLAGPPRGRFVGYRVYKVTDWRHRQSLLPPRDDWSLLAAFGPDSGRGERPLAAVTDTTVPYDRIEYRRKHYPVGRYRMIDDHVLNGFDYLYVVTSVTETDQSGRLIERQESPLVASFDQRVVPHATSLPDGQSVWVVPNPFRANADWDRPAIGGDGLTRHIDFMGLPRARSTIRIWTVAGDLVAELAHDGSGGDGQVAWDLVSRNGQDVESGIYLFTVESPLGRQIGRFVVIR